MAFNFSANTGYLWKELPFLDRIRSAKKYGFHSVELHDEAHFEDLGDLKSLLKEVGLPVNSMNIRMGPSFGCAAIPDRQHIARHDIREAARLAQEIGAKALHILSGFSEQTPEAFETFVENLEYALDHSTLTIVIEPVCEEQLPGYFLRTLAQAGQVLDAINNPRLKIMFDCYHVFIQSGDLLEHFSRYVDKIGHIQIAAAEQRAEPFPGALDYGVLLPQFQALGYQGAFGCEYCPKSKTEAGLSWRDQFSTLGG